MHALPPKLSETTGLTDGKDSPKDGAHLPAAHHVEEAAVEPEAAALHAGDRVLEFGTVPHDAGDEAQRGSRVAGRGSYDLDSICRRAKEEGWQQNEEWDTKCKERAEKIAKYSSDLRKDSDCIANQCSIKGAMCPLRPYMMPYGVQLLEHTHPVEGFLLSLASLLALRPDPIPAAIAVGGAVISAATQQAEENGLMIFGPYPPQSFDSEDARRKILNDNDRRRSE